MYTVNVVSCCVVLSGCGARPGEAIITYLSIIVLASGSDFEGLSKKSENEKIN